MRTGNTRSATAAQRSNGLRASIDQRQTQHLPARREAQGLVRAGEDRHCRNQWLLIKHKDGFAQPNDVLADRLPSSRASRSMIWCTGSRRARLDAARLAPSGPRRRCLTRLGPMLAKTGEAARSDPDGASSPSWTAIASSLSSPADGVRLQSRRGHRSHARSSRRSSRSLRCQPAYTDDPRRRDRRPGSGRAAVVQRTAESGATTRREG